MWWERMKNFTKKCWTGKKCTKNIAENRGKWYVAIIINTVMVNINGLQANGAKS